MLPGASLFARWSVYDDEISMPAVSNAKTKKVSKEIELYKMAARVKINRNNFIDFKVGRAHK